MPAAATAVQAETTSATTAEIVFPHGLVGCETWKRFVLLTDETEDLPVATLQSLDDSLVTLMVTDPRLILPEYDVPLDSTDHAVLEIEPSDEPVVFTTITVADGWITTNLLGPLVVNPRTNLGKQVVLGDASYSTRYRIAPLGGDDAALD
jgi:flagellar assembly factor FliW